jgi:hypothetical protein
MLTLLRRVGGPIAAVALLLPVIANQVHAQTPADSGKSTAAHSDSSTVRSDSSAAGYGASNRQPGVDTSRAALPADSSRGPASKYATAPLPQAGIPSDSVLSVTCRSMRAGSVAPGLLLVLFRDSTTAKDRTAAVGRAGGATAGEAPGGGQYVRLATDTISARTLADQLVQDPAVASVSERTCPSGP